MVAISDVVNSIKEPVREIIGRVSRTVMIWRNTVSLDRTPTDFFFWDRFRRGALDGARLSGLFAKPASEIKADWVMGDGFQVALATDDQSEAVTYTNSVIKRFVGRVKSTFLTMVTDYYALGNQYVIVNPDGSLSIPSPDTVTMEYDVLDYRQPVKATVKTRYEKFVVSDEYRLDGRTISIETADAEFRAKLLADGWQPTSKANIVEQGYDNLIGRLPVVHFANDRSANEINGRPMYEPLLSLFQRYDAALEKALDAAEIMANPIPVFEGMEDVQETIDQNSTPEPNEQYQSANGSYVDRVRIAFDRFATIIIGKGGRFTFASPTKGYTDDVKSMLKLLFLLVLENLRIPEVVWGGELGQSRASAGEQMKTFYMHITGRRLALEGMSADESLGAVAQGGLHELMDIWLRTVSLIDRRVMVAPLQITWSPLGEADDKQNMEWANSMKDRGAITTETYVRMSGRIEDAAEEVKAADVENAEKKDAFDAAVDNAANQTDNTDPAATDQAA